MNIQYQVMHCWRKDYDDERWDIIQVFETVEEAIYYQEQNSVEEGFIFISVEWCK